METSNLITLGCDIASTDSSIPLGIRVKVDDQTLYENPHVTDQEKIEFTMPDSNAEHELVFELFNKLPEHTQLNDAGEIIKDVLVDIKNLTIDEIDISSVFQQLAVYSHDYNGSQQLTEHRFHGTLGCNGAVKLKFTTPVYLWLLENM